MLSNNSHWVCLIEPWYWGGFGSREQTITHTQVCIKVTWVEDRRFKRLYCKTKVPFTAVSLGDLRPHSSCSLMSQAWIIWSARHAKERTSSRSVPLSRMFTVWPENCLVTEQASSHSLRLSRCLYVSPLVMLKRLSVLEAHDVNRLSNPWIVLSVCYWSSYCMNLDLWAIMDVSMLICFYQAYQILNFPAITMAYCGFKLPSSNSHVMFTLYTNYSIGEHSFKLKWSSSLPLKKQS